MTSYTEFNKDMFLCNNFENTSAVYSKDNTILSTPSNLSEATFYNYTKILGLPDNELAPHHKKSLEKIINPGNNAPKTPYDISYALYNYLNNNKKNYEDFQKTNNPNDTWIYTFGQLVDSHIYTDIVPTTDKHKENIQITYKPTYT